MRFRWFHDLWAALQYLRQARPEHVPIPVTEYRGTDPTTLWLLLPGRGDRPGDFEAHRFIEDARNAGVTADIVSADAHLTYYHRRHVVTRLWEDVVAPARARGVSRIVILGISLGGLGALLLARAHPEAAQMVILLAPYLGPDELLEEIERAGGLSRWEGGGGDAVRNVWEFRGLWVWLRGQTSQPEGARPPIVLAYGENDRYGQGHRVLAQALPPSDVLTAPGGHDWPTWRGLWGRLLPAISPAR